MAIDVNKPVYVFDQERNKWYTKVDEDWVEIGTPTLTPNFAGIGTRNINQMVLKLLEMYMKIHSELRTYLTILKN